MPKIQLALIKEGERLRQMYDETKMLSLMESIRDNGLIQPLLIDKDYNLIAGGRRFRACQRLGLEEVQVYIREDITNLNRRKLEIEENSEREPMTWQERVLGIYQVHEDSAADALQNKMGWTTRETGRLLNMEHSGVAKALNVAKAIKLGDEEINQAESFVEAIGILLRRKQLQAEAALKMCQTSAVQVVPVAQDRTESSDASDVVMQFESAGEVMPTTLVEVNLSSYFHLGNSLEMMNGSMPPLSIDHVLTDIPYATEVDQMSIANADDIADEHDVEENLSMFEPFLVGAYRVLRPGGFCAFWMELTHIEKLMALGKKVGFKVQRWPIIWCKTSPCSNKAAFANVTKAAEAALIFRKGNASLTKPIMTNWFTASSSEAQRKYQHPFAKPKECWQFFLDAFAKPGQIILDPYAGEMSCPEQVLEFGAQPFAIETKQLHFDRGMGHIQMHYRKKFAGNVRFV